jgi:hypothetical protein
VTPQNLPADELPSRPSTQSLRRLLPRRAGVVILETNVRGYKDQHDVHADVQYRSSSTGDGRIRPLTPKRRCQMCDFVIPESGSSHHSLTSPVRTQGQCRPPPLRFKTHHLLHHSRLPVVRRDGRKITQQSKELHRDGHANQNSLAMAGRVIIIP